MAFSPTTPRNAFKTALQPTGSVNFTVDPAGTINPGDILQWDPALGQAKPVTATADGAAFCGVAEGQIPIASNIDNQTGLENSLQAMVAGVANFKTEVGQTYKHGDFVSPGTVDAQSVIVTQAFPGAKPATAIGQVFLPDGTALAGAVGQLVPVLIATATNPVA